MKCLLPLVIYIVAVLAHPIVEVNPDCKNCIRMNKETEDEIEDIISKIGDFIMDLLQTHDRFHIKHLKLELQAHSKDENENEVLFEITINDCPDSHADEEEDNKKERKEHEGFKKTEKSNIEQIKNKQENIPPKQSEKTKENQESGKQNGEPKKWVQPEIMTLDLDELGLDLMKRLDTMKGNTPLVVYIQKIEGPEGLERRVTFLNRK